MPFPFRRKSKNVITASRAHAAFNLPEIAIQLMSYLQPEHLLVCLQVCRSWKAIFELELWANVVYLQPRVLPKERIAYGHPMNDTSHLPEILEPESAFHVPMRPGVRYVNWWCKPSGSSKLRRASSDTGSLICQSCNHLMAQGLNYRDLHLTLASQDGGREDAGGSMRRRITVGGGGRWMVYRRMTPEQWKERGPLIRSLAGINIWDTSLVANVAKYCGGEGGGMLQHLDMEITFSLHNPMEQLERVTTFFSAFSLLDGGGGGGGTLTSLSIQFCDREADLKLLWSLGALTSLRTLEIRGLVDWAMYSAVNKDDMAVGATPMSILCRVEDLLGVVVHSCPDLETLRLTKLLIEERTSIDDSNINNEHQSQSGAGKEDDPSSIQFPEIQTEDDLRQYSHTRLRRLILPMPWRERPAGVGDVYQSLFRAFSHLQDLDLTVVNMDCRQRSANETLAEILQHSGQHLQSLTLRFKPDDASQDRADAYGMHIRGSLDFQFLSKFFPKTLRSLSLRDVRLHESNFTKISPEVLGGIRRLRLNYRELSAAQVTQADLPLDRGVCCFATELFEFVMFNFPSLAWLEIAQGRGLGMDFYNNVDGEGDAVFASQGMHHPRVVAGIHGVHQRQLQQRPWACRYTLEYLDIHRFPLFYDKAHAKYVDHVLTERLSSRVMPQLKHLGVNLLLFRLPYEAMSTARSRDDVKNENQEKAGGQEPLSPSSSSSPTLDFGQLRSLFVQGGMQPWMSNALDSGRTKTHSLSVVELNTLKRQILGRGARLEYCHFGELKSL